MPDVITASRLADGVVVFQTAEHGWSEDFNRAAVRPDEAATDTRGAAPADTAGTAGAGAGAAAATMGRGTGAAFGPPGPGSRTLSQTA